MYFRMPIGNPESSYAVFRQNSDTQSHVVHKNPPKSVKKRSTDFRKANRRELQSYRSKTICLRCQPKPARRSRTLETMKLRPQI